MIGKRRWRVSVAADGKAVDSQRRLAENDHRAGIEVSLHGFEVVEDDRCLGDHTPIRRTPQEEE